MPRQYEAIRNKFEGEGMSTKAAKSHAAAIYNSQHPGRPVTGKSDAEKASGTRKLAHALIGR